MAEAEKIEDILDHVHLPEEKVKEDDAKEQIAKDLGEEDDKYYSASDKIQKTTKVRHNIPKSGRGGY